MALNFVPAVSPGSRWQPGQSGNPGGRSVDRRGQQIAEKYMPDAFKALVVALNFKGERVAAAKEILDRALGRPKQSIETTGDPTQLLQLLAAHLVSEEIRQAQVAPQTQTNIQPTLDHANLLDAPKPSE